MTCIWKPEGSDFGIAIRSEPSRVTLCLAAALALMSPMNASAAPDVAHATRVTAMASAGPEARPRALFSGASLLQDEWVRTDATGRADLSFIDGTQLTVGPSAAVKLDRFIYAPKSGAAAFVINATKGLFRFTTGNLPKAAYQIRTPVGVLGVRGTQFTFRVEPSRVVVSVTEGRVISCPRTSARSGCTEAGVGQSLVATPTRVNVMPTNSLPAGLGLPIITPLGIELPRLRTDLPLPLPLPVAPLNATGGLGLGLGRDLGSPIPSPGGLLGGGHIGGSLPRLGR